MTTNQISETSTSLCNLQPNILGKQISFRVIGKSVPKQSAQFHVTGKGRKVNYVTGKVTERYKLRSYQPDKVVNWHNEITSSDTYFRISTDAGITWKNLDSDLIREGSTNKYYTDTKVQNNAVVVANTSARHTHSNKSILDNIIDNGTGTNFLSDNGTYKAISTRVILTKTGNYTLSAGDEVILLDATSNTVTATLPTAVGISGTVFIIKCINDTYACNIDTTSSQTIDGNLTLTLSNMESVTLISNGANYYIL